MRSIGPTPGSGVPGLDTSGTDSTDPTAPGTAPAAPAASRTPAMSGRPVTGAPGATTTAIGADAASGATASLDPAGAIVVRGRGGRVRTGAEADALAGRLTLERIRSLPAGDALRDRLIAALDRALASGAASLTRAQTSELTRLRSGAATATTATTAVGVSSGAPIRPDNGATLAGTRVDMRQLEEDAASVGLQIRESLDKINAAIRRQIRPGVDPSEQVELSIATIKGLFGPMLPARPRGSATVHGGTFVIESLPAIKTTDGRPALVTNNGAQVGPFYSQQLVDLRTGRIYLAINDGRKEMIFGPVEPVRGARIRGQLTSQQIAKLAKTIDAGIRR